MRERTYTWEDWAEFEMQPARVALQPDRLRPWWDAGWSCRLGPGPPSLRCTMLRHLARCVTPDGRSGGVGPREHTVAYTPRM